jgi:hypothetical protein
VWRAKEGPDLVIECELQMAKRVFISYRRSDEPLVAQLAYFILLEFLPREMVLVDTERLSLGRSFDAQLMKAIADCDVVLVIIGERWLRRYPEEKSRLLDPEDFVRREISYALELRKVLIPIILEGGRLPTSASLPKELEMLPSIQGVKLRTERFKNDLLEACIRANILSLSDIAKETPQGAVSRKAQADVVTKFAHASAVLNAVLTAVGGVLAFSLLESSLLGMGEGKYEVAESGWNWDLDWEKAEWSDDGNSSETK